MNRLKLFNKEGDMSRKGFSFIALSIMIVFVGIMLYGTISKMISKGGLQVTQNTKDKIYTIERAINDFAVKNKRLPCPASLTDIKSDSTYSSERTSDGECDATVDGVFQGTEGNNSENLFYGAVPARTLGLKDSDGIDEWGGKISYIIDGRFAVKNTDISQDVGFAYVMSDDSNISGDISIDSSNAVFVIISHGRDKKGAYEADGDDVYGSESDTNFVNSGSFDETFAMSGTTGIDDLVVYGTKDEIKNRSFSIGTEDYKACICEAFEYTELSGSLNWDRARCGEIKYSNETCPKNVNIGQASSDYYYLSEDDTNRPYLICEKDGNWEDTSDMHNPCLLLPNCSTGELPSQYNSNYTITWDTSDTPYVNTSQASGTIVIDETTYNVSSYCKINTLENITDADMTWTAAVLGSAQITCSAVTEATQDSGYATWPTTSADDTATGTCMSNYKEDTTAPTRDCTINGWDTVSNPCIPDIPSGQMLWLDAADSSTITLNGSNVSAWADKSGNELNTVQATSSYQPAYTDTLNGESVVTFDGSNDIMAFAEFMNSATPTIFIVGKTSTGSVETFFKDYGDVGAKLLSVIGQSGSLTSTARDSGGDSIVISGSDSTLSPSIFMMQVNGTTLTTRVNGVERTNTNAAYDSSTTWEGSHSTDPYLGKPTIGGFALNTNTLNGYIAELIIYSSVLSESEKEDIELYLANKWGINIDANVCSAIASGDESSGYATWPESHDYDGTITGTCISGYVEDGSAPTRTCVGGEWQTISDPCVAIIPTGMALWLDAADSSTITLNGSNVSVWTDKSGNGLEFTMENSSYQPAYTENAINSLSALNFDGTNDYIRIIDTTLLKNASEYTIFAIINYNTSNTVDILSVMNSSSEHGLLLELNNTNAGSIRTIHRHPYSSSGGDGILTGGSIVSSNTTYSIRIETSVTSGNQKLYVNDVLKGEDTSWSATTFDANHNVYLGMLGISARFYKQYIGEIIIYESIPNSTEIDQIESYLANKWGI